MSRHIYEGFIYVYPYAGDDVFLYPEKVDLESLPLRERIETLSRLHREALEGQGMSLLGILEELEGKQVRIVIEDKRITIEVVDS